MLSEGGDDPGGDAGTVGAAGHRSHPGEALRAPTGRHLRAAGPRSCQATMHGRSAARVQVLAPLSMYSVHFSLRCATQLDLPTELQLRCKFSLHCCALLKPFMWRAVLDAPVGGSCVKFQCSDVGVVPVLQTMP